MPSKVRLLSENVANMIAAGEVVERPASVVKELVENSLDAGASRVLVDVRTGGRKLISVVDNGSGMTPDDALLSLERHATSKISSEKDLFSVSSLGFRGEALPAIASVCRLSLRTAAKGSDHGTRIFAEGGTVKEVTEEAVPPGTQVEVADLFFNTPGRRKFLRSPETELTHIVETLTRLVLPKDGVFFRLRQEGKTLLQVAGTDDQPARIASLLGKDAGLGLNKLSWEGPHFRLEGFISGPETTRSSAGQLFVYCNGRFLRDRLITHAINTGYRGHVLKGRDPVVVLMIEIPPELVDVNVHPTKSEVRFRKPSGVYEGIVAAIDQTLRTRFGAPEATLGQTFEQAAGPSPPTAPHDAQEEKQRIEDAIHRFTTAHTSSLFRDPRQPSTKELDVAARADVGLAPQDVPDEEGAFSRMAIAGQIFNNYIVCETRDSKGMMVLIDAHAAHERILFEKLKKDYEDSAVAVQGQLMPITLELRRLEAAALKNSLPTLAKVGIEVENFGGDTFRITAIPAILSPGEAEGAVRECIEKKMETGQNAPMDSVIDKFLAVLACHSAVRSGQELTIAQMREILRGLDRVPNAGSCPHGRPTFWAVPLSEIEKRFKRR